MAGLVVLMLAVAIPLGIVVFTVIATESERKTYRHPAVSRFFTSLVFVSAALAGTAIVLVPRAYDSGLMLMLGIPAALIAALLATAAHRFLIARSKLIAAMSGTVITLLTVLGAIALIAILFSPEKGIAMTIVTFGAVLVLSQKVLLFYSSALWPECCSVAFQTINGLTRRSTRTRRQAARRLASTLRS